MLVLFLCFVYNKLMLRVCILYLINQLYYANTNYCSYVPAFVFFTTCLDESEFARNLLGPQFQSDILRQLTLICPPTAIYRL